MVRQPGRPGRTRVPHRRPLPAAVRRAGRDHHRRDRPDRRPARDAAHLVPGRGRGPDAGRVPPGRVDARTARHERRAGGRTGAPHRRDHRAARVRRDPARPRAAVAGVPDQTRRGDVVAAVRGAPRGRRRGFRTEHPRGVERDLCRAGARPSGPVAGAGHPVRRLRGLATGPAQRRAARRPADLLAYPARRPARGARGTDRPAAAGGAHLRRGGRGVHVPGRGGRAAGRPDPADRGDALHGAARRVRRAAAPALRRARPPGRGTGGRPGPAGAAAADRHVRQHDRAAAGRVR